MTRQEEIIEAGIEYTTQSSPRCIGGGNFYERVRELNRNRPFEAGAKWADDNPYIEWLNFKEQEPPFGEEVLAFNKEWIDEDFNPRGIRVGFLSDEGFISAFWYDEQDCYETISKLHCESNRDFYRSHIDNTEPEFWTYFPEFVNPLNNRR